MKLPIESTVASLIARPMAAGATAGVARPIGSPMAYSRRQRHEEALLNPIDPCRLLAEVSP